MTILESMTTPLDWADEVLDAKTREQIEDIVRWARRQDPLRKGYRCLFHGAAGRGQKLAAALLAQACGRPAYRIDLGKAKDIDAALKRKGAVVLVDATDRAANQQTAYLLQRIEDFPGIVILASNVRAHLNEEFARRFQSVVMFKARASSRARRAARSRR